MGWSSPHPPTAATTTSEQPAHKTKQIKDRMNEREGDEETEKTRGGRT